MFVLKERNPSFTQPRTWFSATGSSNSVFEATEFMHVYNTIIVLKEILPVLPLDAVGDAGPAIDTAMEKFLEKEERGDLKILGRAIPRPEKVRRGVAKSDAMDVDVPSKELKLTQVPISEHNLRPTPRLHQGSSQNATQSTLTVNHKDALKIQRPPSSSSVQNSWEPPHSPRPITDEKQTQAFPSEAMPPPYAPSQTISAQELRETAKQSIGCRPPDRADDKRS
ncbi:hypothetical protein EV702DRAFT_1257169 [Suillus placidus]|uniref:THO complex subunitTHOC2 C-terminal domain-containing protein n=1 Tax=Suillus placidus TaxID=48579 RepID=A0A9P6ZHS8_9AGAM|nr:hypothetical protein EV702DRAFT_1257169 [Suillus placidus]